MDYLRVFALPIPGPDLLPQLLVEGTGAQFVFDGPGPQFAFTDPSPQFVFYLFFILLLDFFVITVSIFIYVASICLIYVLTS